MAQIQKGTTYTQTGTGSQVTHTNLNAHVDNATLTAGAIDEQTYNPTSSDSDTFLITKSGVLYKQSKSDFTGTLNTKSIDAGALNDFTVTAYDGNTVTGSTYSSSNGLINTVTTGSAHNLTVGQIVLISSASNYFYNGYYTIKTVPSSTSFSYELNQFDMYSGTGSFSSSNGTLVTVTTGTAHGFSNNQPLSIIASNIAYSGNFNITVTGVNTFTYTLITSTTAGTGTINYITTSAIAGNGTLSYKKMAIVKVNGNQSITGVLSVAGTTDLFGDVYVKGNQINDGGVIQNGTVNVTGSIQYNGTPVFGLYEVYEETITSYTSTTAATWNNGWSSASFTKPSNEIWKFEMVVSVQTPSVASTTTEDHYLKTTNTANSVTYYHRQGKQIGVVAQTITTPSFTHELHWIVNAGTALTSETVKFWSYTKVGTGTYTWGYTGSDSITGTTLPASKLRIYKYKTA